MRLLFHCDAGPSVGMGHVVRGMAIARAAGDEALARMFVPDVWPGLRAFARSMGVEVTVGGTDGRDVVAAAPDFDVVVLDGYRFSFDYQREVRALRPLAVVDDLGRHDLCADLIINHNPYAVPADYDSRAELLLGPTFALLRPSFAQARERYVPRQELERIYVSFGGTDPTQEIPRVLHALEDFTGSIDVVTATSGSRLKGLQEKAGRLRSSVTVHASIPDPSELMVLADLAITAAGGTSWELACVGVPAIEYVVAPNQVLLGEWLSKNRLAMVHSAPVRSQALRELVTRFEGSPRERLGMASRARTLVDGQGAKRVFDELRKLA